MKNIGSIGGKVEILIEPEGGLTTTNCNRVRLISSSNLIALTHIEAVELSAVLQFAAIDQIDNMPFLTTFIRKIE